MIALHSPTDTYAFFATCARNTEGLLLEELQALGAARATETRAGASFEGPLSQAYKVCLWSRVASRVLLRLKTFPVGDPDALYEVVREVPWEDHLDPRGTMAVEVTSAITQGPLANLNTHFAEQRIKDAVVDRFRDRTGGRPGVDLARPDLRLNVHLAPTEAVLSLDLSGDGLHRRGYRLEGGEAPLKENLAAAILMRSKWPAIAAAGGTLLDPMCGSGTLLIEGALMAADIAPGLLRDYYGFLGWLGFDPAPWSALLEEARTRREEGLVRMPAIYGFDSDRRAVGAARANARRAGLAGRLAFDIRDLSALTPPAGKPGLVVTNPPYGKRLGDVVELVPLYETLGEKLRRSFSGWEAAVFTGNPELGAHLNLRAHRVNVFHNGPIACKLLLFDIDPAQYQAPGSADREGGVVEISAGAEMFANRLRKNSKHLRRWAAREGITCYRVYDSDLPEYAVAVDLYGDRAHVQEYAPPRTVDPVKARRRLKEIMSVISDALQLEPDNVVLKVRRPQRGPEQYQKLRDDGNFIEVQEGGLSFLVNLTDYLDTGLFLDHRLTRQLIRETAPGRRFLNLFAYTGTAGVYAAAGGAASTTTVDLSPTYLDWARRNFDLNGFAGPEHGYIRADCLEWLPHAARDRSTIGAYDLIFLDPPTFSNSKSMEGVLDVQLDHAQMIRDCVSLLSPAGELLFSTNFRRFKMDPEMVEEFEVDDISRQTIPQDFARSPNIHRCFRISRKGAQPRRPEGPRGERSGD
jgi:23S rRNA (guanine2445-N2)-methyltransferase / 23S rRNA (guanine2069-N7)-methyltransferase